MANQFIYRYDRLNACLLFDTEYEAKFNIRCIFLDNACDFDIFEVTLHEIVTLVTIAYCINKS